MARYQIDGTEVVETTDATHSWVEERDWDGRNHIGRSSRSPWRDQTLHRSPQGRYYIEFCSRLSGEDRCEWVSDREARAFLVENDLHIPEDLE
jgi:hypothetical protein